MKHKFLIMFIILVPIVLCAQQDLNGWYANAGFGYGSYELDFYNYNGGSDSYADQKMTQPVFWLGFDKKSIWQKTILYLMQALRLQAVLELK